VAEKIPMQFAMPVWAAKQNEMEKTSNNPVVDVQISFFYNLTCCGDSC
jgi:hypothetical protein